MYKVDVSSNHLIKFLSNMDNNRMLFSTHVSSLSTSSFAIIILAATNNMHFIYKSQ